MRHIYRTPRRTHTKKLFNLKAHGTTVPREIRAGLTTFFAIACIVFVNPVFLSATGMDPDGALIATCLGAAIDGLLRGETALSGVLSLIALLITMTIVDMFDTIGYLVGTGTRSRKNLTPGVIILFGIFLLYFLVS